MRFDELCGENQILAANAFSLAISNCKTAAETATLARFFSISSTMLASIAACKLEEEISQNASNTNANNSSDNIDFVPPAVDFER